MTFVSGGYEDDDSYWDDDPYPDDDPRCICDGSGIRVTCIDDMCRGAGECMHGDGEELCPVHF